MKKVVFIIPPENFRDEELLSPLGLLKKKGILTDVASTEIKSIRGVKGAHVKSTLKISDINLPEYDAVIVVGGEGTEKHLWNYKPLRELFILANQKGKIIGGICAGSVVLAHTGLLKGMKATTFPSESFIKELKNSGAVYTGRGLEYDDTIITASGPAAADEFGKAIIHALNSKSKGRVHKRVSVHESETIPMTTPFDDY